jgi:hypothetical protein
VIMVRRMDIQIKQTDHPEHQQGLDGHFDDGTLAEKGTIWNRIPDASDDMGQHLRVR